MATHVQVMLYSLDFGHGQHELVREFESRYSWSEYLLLGR